MARSLLECSILIGVLAGFSQAATVQFTVTGTDSANITITLTGRTVTGISGTFDGSNISSLDTLLEFGDNDNQFFATAPYVDNQGLSFALATPDSFGYTYINLWAPGSAPFLTPPSLYASTQDTINTGNGRFGPFGPDAITVSPEPGTCALILMAIGLAAVIRARHLSLSFARCGTRRTPKAACGHFVRYATLAVYQFGKRAAREAENCR